MNLDNDMYNLSDIVRFKKEYGLKYKDSIGYQYLTEVGPPYHCPKTYESCEIDFECLQGIVKKNQQITSMMTPSSFMSERSM